ncbi:MAG: hypothetical protein GSR80_000319 [Desulfurococcales archaeon]|nr:hypothetical protein [Desulfurococcales archaeon]
MVRVFLVLPDVSEAKCRAICLAGPLDVLVSYTTLKWKPSTLARLLALRRRGCLSSVMLDSGAYHLARLGARVDPREYAADSRSGLGPAWDLVVAPDVPGDPEATLERTLEFIQSYGAPFLPVAQPPPGPADPRRHALEAERLVSRGLLEWSPRLPGGRRLLGLGGLDGPRRRVSYIAGLLEEVESRLGGVSLHLFGVGARILAGLARRGLLGLVYSVDSSGWLAEIRFRRRTHYRAPGVVEANAAAMKGYLARLARVLGGG